MIGIYSITDNGQNVYVGQSTDIDNRCRVHLKHRWPTGSYSVLEECARADLDAREEYWIDKLDTYHNGENVTPYAVHRPFDSETSRVKASASAKAMYQTPMGKEKARKWGEKMVKYRTGRPRPDNDERNKKIHGGNTYRKGATSSDEHKRKISESIKKHWETRR